MIKQSGSQLRHVVCLWAYRDAHKYACARLIRAPIVKFCYVSLANHPTERPEGARLLWNRDAENGLATLTYISPFGDITESVKVRIGAAENGNDCGVTHIISCEIGLHTRYCKRTGGFCDGTRIVKYILYCCAHFIRSRCDNVVYILFDEPVRFGPYARHSTPVRKESNLI